MIKCSNNIHTVYTPYTPTPTPTPTPPHRAGHTRETGRKPEWPYCIVRILPTVRKTIQGSSHKC
jgi:hypothetical protein